MDFSESYISFLNGRFAPSPTGRMHLGNVFTALISWLAAKSSGGKWILRIEDLDPQRSRIEYARMIEDDLHWLGLDFDEGGLEDIGPNAPYSQSRRNDIYARVLNKLKEKALLYPCSCTRADILATQAPHQSDGRIVYAGTCRPSPTPPFPDFAPTGKALRLYAPDEVISFCDSVYGPQSINLAAHCGDFILRRADGAWAYMLAVVVDDAMMGVREIVRGRDLLLSTAQQIYLYRLLGFQPPRYTHLPLICNTEGRRLSKRDPETDMEHLRRRFRPEEIIGHLAHLANLIPEYQPVAPSDLIPLFRRDRLPKSDILLSPKS